MKSLNKITQWAADRNIDLTRLVSRLDRFSMRLGLIEKPVIFMSFWGSVAFLSSYWILFFPIIAFVMGNLLFEIPAIQQFTVPQSLILHLLIGFTFGVILSYDRKRVKKKVQLPPWEFFESKES